MGLISNIQPAPSKRNRKQPQTQVECFEEDDEDDEEFAQTKDQMPVVDEADELMTSQQSDRLTDADKGCEDTAKGADMEEFIKDARDDEQDRKKEQFLYETENAIKILFSAHYRDKGLIW